MLSKPLKVLTKGLYAPWLKSLNTPAYQQIQSTVSRNRWLVITALVGNMLAASFEALTLSTIFLALGVLEGDQLPSLPAWLTEVLGPIQQNYLFLALVGLAVVLQVVRSALTYGATVAAGDLSARVQAQMIETVFSRIVSFSFPCASRYKVGDLTNYVGEAGYAVEFQMRALSGLLSGFTLVVAYAVTVVSISLPMTGVAVLLFSGLIFVQQRLLPRLQATSVNLSQSQVEVSKNIVENIQALRVVHTFGHQVETVSQVSHLQGKVLRLLQRQARLMAIPAPLNGALTILMVAALLVAGSFLLGHGQTAVLPALVTFILSLNRLSMQLQGVLGHFNALGENSGRIFRLNEVLQVSGKQFTRQGGQAFDQLTREIAFQRVWLQYEGVTTPNLVDVSFTLPKNTVTALVGESGAGKSSLVDLLIGLYDPTAGQVLIDGLDLQTYSLASWRSRLGVVSQDTFIFNQSILDNIRYGAPLATDAQVRQAARQAHAHDFIEGLPQGYHTLVGERGYTLSGGQRQRLALARAILKQPEVLILDEATSALDSHSEQLVQQALEQFQRDRTVLVIAHRLSTTVHADQILVLEQGRVVEQGTHAELLALQGRYTRAWQIQTVGWARVRGA